MDKPDLFILNRKDVISYINSGLIKTKTCYIILYDNYYDSISTLPLTLSFSSLRCGSEERSVAWCLTSVEARFVATARFVTKVINRIKFDALPARFVTAARFVTMW